MRRRPPFALVLVALAAVLGGVIALLSGGGSSSRAPAQSLPQQASTPSTPQQASASGCATARAQAAATAQHVLRAPVTVRVPVSVTEQSGTASVTLSEQIVERGTGTRTIEVQRTAVVSRRACARGSTPDAARSVALTHAYDEALAAARAQAKGAANNAAAQFAAQQLPALQAQTRGQLESAARAGAVAAHQTLAQQALAKARATGH